MLAQPVIAAILADGSFYKDEFDFETNQPRTTDKARLWFSKRYNIKNTNSAFIDFYNLVGSSPAGNGPILYDLEQIDKAKDDSSDGERLLIASGDTGSLIYNICTDEVYEYDCNISDTSKAKLIAPFARWESFSAFVDNYYGTQH